MKKVLILGGSGFVGRSVCRLLSRQDYQVIVVTREQLQAPRLCQLPGVRYVQVADFSSQTLQPLVAGCDAVLNLIAILHGTEAMFEQVHVRLPGELARACEQAAVKRLVHVSSLGADLNAPSMYQRSKARGELVLKNATLDLTLLRPSVIFGQDDQFLNVFAKLQRFFPIMPLAGSGARFQPVWVEDVAQAVVRCFEDEGTIGQTFELCGPEVLSLKQLVQLAGLYSGIQKNLFNGQPGRLVIELPYWLGCLQAWVMEHLPGPTLMSRDNLDSMKADNIASGQCQGLQGLGVTPTPLNQVAAGYLRR